MRMSTDEDKLILASSSPRRRALLADAGVEFDVVAPPLEEPADLPMSMTPTAQAEALAYFKARSVADGHPRRWVLGADTIVALGERILGKPDDEADARRMLDRLSHNRHAVVTGVALIAPGEQRWLASDTTFVTMRPMSPADIDRYIATGEWQGKAGAYAIQETADRYIERLDGSFSNVVGLPMELVTLLLARAHGDRR